MPIGRRILLALILLGGLLTGQAGRLKTVRGAMIPDPGPNWMKNGNGRQMQIVVIRHGDRLSKKVAFTFDDGPFPVYTPELLDLLGRYHVHATFFVNGRHVVESPELALEIANRGHELANHTFSHVNLTKVNALEAVRELTATAEAVGKATGRKMDLFRPPGGQYNPVVLQEAADAGYKTVLWTINTADYETSDSSLIVKRVLGHIHGGDIILMHSGLQQTIEALPQILDKLAAEGYRFVTVAELTSKPLLAATSKPSLAAKGEVPAPVPQDW